MDGIATSTKEKIVQKAIEMGYLPFSYANTLNAVASQAKEPDQETNGFQGEIALLTGGFDDSAESRSCNPPLTTVHIHTQTMAYSAVQLLMTRISAPSLDYRYVYTETDLIYRASAPQER